MRFKVGAGLTFQNIIIDSKDSLVLCKISMFITLIRQKRKLVVLINKPKLL